MPLCTRARARFNHDGSPGCAFFREILPTAAYSEKSRGWWQRLEETLKIPDKLMDIDFLIYMQLNPLPKHGSKTPSPIFRSQIEYHHLLFTIDPSEM